MSPVGEFAQPSGILIQICFEETTRYQLATRTVLIVRNEASASRKRKKANTGRRYRDRVV